MSYFCSLILIEMYHGKMLAKMLTLIALLQPLTTINPWYAVIVRLNNEIRVIINSMVENNNITIYLL